MSAMPWLDAAIDVNDAAILVTVASVEGSAPRETGAAMLITASREIGTIGGGHLELCAIEVARTMLTQPDVLTSLTARRRLERLPLGPTLGQCCGGVVYLAFERIDASGTTDRTILSQRWHQGTDTWRLVPLDAPDAPLLVDGDGHLLSGAPLEGGAVPEFDHLKPCHLVRDAEGKRWLVDPCLPYRTRLFLFGAGHVGAALVRALEGLPCHVTWVDERADIFPAVVPANVTIEVCESPESMVDAAPAGASFLVMTHSHPLDQRLAECILARTDVGWFGLIGSRTKRIQFERRLRARGIDEQRIAAMTCPIGIAGIEGKAPTMIAIAVAAQLLQVWERQAAAAEPGQEDATTLNTSPNPLRCATR
ncbi:MAG: xanthine dehydrogenase accessory protein XdhC [Tardiphaga sp.]|uniref:xanthine dehydrogenase accessory protein XdhC n=1 Tax=Tardiphaga sp. TaxID=1926292 RepID=UPI0019BE1328|nr:xanthine dehydrogenase accessory protein XdhC [Tardiphaga sp.]MBC7584355.1 xanthine dehydrogenase accessory protein XdhC [Tardiphaga sp.]